MLSKCFIFPLQKNNKTHSPKTSLPMLRDRAGHSSIFTTVGVRLGDSRVDSHLGSGGVQDGRPGSSAWRRHSSTGCQSSQTSPSPAFNTSWQHPTSCSTNLIPHPGFMYMIMYKICTQERCKNSITFEVTLLSLSCVFSLCILLDFAPTNMRVIWWQKHRNSHRRLQKSRIFFCEFRLLSQQVKRS